MVVTAVVAAGRSTSRAEAVLGVFLLLWFLVAASAVRGVWRAAGAMLETPAARLAAVVPFALLQTGTWAAVAGFALLVLNR